MSYRPKILVADRNRNIREFICRELIKDGYEVETASDGRTIKNKIEEGNVADMLIMDLDLPYINGFQILDLIHKAKPALPVVVHALITEVPDHPSIQWASAFIEKTGDNIELLRRVISDVLKTHYPLRFSNHIGKQAGLND